MKNKKKISIIATSTLAITGLIGTGVGLGVNSHLFSNANNFDFNSKTNSSHNQPVMLQNKHYDNLDKATNAYIQENAIINDQFYIGDLADAIFFGSDFQEVNELKLKPYDVTKIKPAYPRSTGGYTDNYQEAKKSMFDTPRNFYLDFDYNKFSNYQKALDSIRSRKNKIPIPYYKIYDHATKKFVKINPLNKNDQLTLKKIAVANLKTDDDNEHLSNSPFKLERFNYLKNKNQYVNNYNAEQAINFSSLFKKLFKELTKIIAQQMIQSLKIKVTLIPKVTNSNFHSVGQDHNIKYKVSSNNQKLIKKDQLLNDIMYFTNKKDFEKAFDVEIEHQFLAGTNWSYKATFNKNKFQKENILGLQNLKFEYDGVVPWHIHEFINGALWGEANISFFEGKISQVYFGANIEFKEFDIDAEKIIEHIKNEKEWKRIFELNNDIINDIKNFLSSFSNSTNSITDVKSNRNDWNIDDLRNYDPDKIRLETEEKLNGIQNKIEDGLQLENTEEIKQFKNLLKNKIKKLFIEEGFSLDNNDGFYGITYNNYYLFKVDLDKINFEKSNQNQSHQSQIKNKLKVILDKNDNQNQLNQALINISNIIDYDANKKISLHKQNLQNHTNSNFNNYLLKLNNNHEIETNNIYKKILGQEISSNNQSIKKALKNQLLKEHGYEDEQLLINNYGIAQAVYYYNKELEVKRNSLLFENDFHAWNEIQKKAIQHPNDIITLWKENVNHQVIPEVIYYGEFLGNKTSFNESASNEFNLKIYSKEKEVNDAIANLINLKPFEIVEIKDRLGNITNYTKYDRDHDGNLDDVSDDYFNNEEIASLNAWNNYQISHSTEYVFYEEENIDVENKNLTLVKFDVNRLWNLELKLLNGTLEKKIFTTYDNVFNYIKNYLSKNVIYLNYHK